MKRGYRQMLGRATRVDGRGFTSGFGVNYDRHRERVTRRKQFWDSIDWDKIKKSLDKKDNSSQE